MRVQRRQDRNKCVCVSAVGFQHFVCDKGCGFVVFSLMLSCTSARYHTRVNFVKRAGFLTVLHHAWLAGQDRGV